MRRFALVVVGVAALVIGGVSGGTQPAATAKARWAMTDLGTLGGHYSIAVAINERGQVVGRSLTADGEQHAFLWEKGRMTDLGQQDTQVMLNERGQVVWNRANRALMLENGAVQDLELYAYAINERGQIVGWSETATANEDGDPVGRWFLWQNGRMTSRGLHAPAEWSDRSYPAINDRGQVVGWSETATKNREGTRIIRGFLSQNGKTTDLGTLGGKQTYPHAINERGQVVGSSYNKAGKLHAFVWENGRMTDLGRSGKGPSLSVAVAINNKGQIVGYSRTGESGFGPPHHAVLWTPKPGS